jgi:hypothetical protein
MKTFNEYINENYPPVNGPDAIGFTPLAQNGGNSQPEYQTEGLKAQLKVVLTKLFGQLEKMNISREESMEMLKSVLQEF